MDTDYRSSTWAVGAFAAAWNRPDADRKGDAVLSGFGPRVPIGKEEENLLKRFAVADAAAMERVFGESDLHDDASAGTHRPGAGRWWGMQLSGSSGNNAGRGKI